MVQLSPFSCVMASGWHIGYSRISAAAHHSLAKDRIGLGFFFVRDMKFSETLTKNRITKSKLQLDFGICFLTIFWPEFKVKVLIYYGFQRPPYLLVLSQSQKSTKNTCLRIPSMHPTEQQSGMISLMRLGAVLSALLCE